MLYHKYNSPRNYYPVYFVFNRMNWVVVLNCLGEWPSPILIFVSRNSAVRLTKPPLQTFTEKNWDLTRPCRLYTAQYKQVQYSETECVGKLFPPPSADMIPSEWVQFNSIIFTGYYIISILTPPLPPHIYSNEKVKQGSSSTAILREVLWVSSRTLLTGCNQYLRS